MNVAIQGISMQESINNWKKVCEWLTEALITSTKKPWVPYTSFDESDQDATLSHLMVRGMTLHAIALEYGIDVPLLAEMLATVDDDTEEFSSMLYIIQEDQSIVPVHRSNVLGWLDLPTEVQEYFLTSYSDEQPDTVLECD